MSKRDSHLKPCSDLCGKQYQTIRLVPATADYVTQSKDLEQKYGDDALVKDLIARKTALNQYEKNPDFPDNEDCFHHCIIFQKYGQ